MAHASTSRYLRMPSRLHWPLPRLPPLFRRQSGVLHSVALTAPCGPPLSAPTVRATLKFEKAGTVDVEYPILAVGASAPGTTSGGGMKMQGGGMMHMDKH
jgi:hypothetical protein